MSSLLAGSDTLVLLERFELAGRTEAHAPSGRSTHAGVIATIDCSNDAENGAHIVIGIAKHSAKRQLPLGEYEARTLVDEFIAERLLPSDSALGAMIAHVLTRFSDLFTENSEISRLRCARFHIHRSDYRIEDVHIWIDSPLHVKARLAAHAHDRKTMFTPRSGTQTPGRRSLK